MKIKSRKKYQRDRLEIESVGERKCFWRFRGPLIKGKILLYDVIDRNFANGSKWLYEIRIPNDNGYIGVRPIIWPNRKEWASLERRTLNFKPNGKNAPYYCKAFVEDAPGGKNRRLLPDNTKLPAWFRQYKNEIKKKGDIIKEAQKDKNHPIFVVREYKAMIEVYFALKVWVSINKYKVN